MNDTTQSYCVPLLIPYYAGAKQLSAGAIGAAEEIADTCGILATTALVVAFAILAVALTTLAGALTTLAVELTTLLAIESLDLHGAAVQYIVVQVVDFRLTQQSVQSPGC